jgi:hypothetical protein
MNTSKFLIILKIFSFTHAKNSKVLGKMKDECGGKPPMEFDDLRSKMYSLLVQSIEAHVTSKMMAKGIQKS